MTKDTNDRDFDPRDRVELTDVHQFYNVQNEKGQTIDYEKANGRELFNHYRHNMTNYDEVLDRTRQKQGHLTGKQEKQATLGAAEQIIEKYRDEHIKVIKDSQKKGRILKDLMTKAGVGTAQALSNLLDLWSTQIKDIAKLENSQRALQSWNDTYRVQRELVKKLLIEEPVSEEIIKKIDLQTSGIYRVLNSQGQVLYIGQAKNIYSRWNNGHHIFSKIIREHDVNLYIDWIEIPVWLLNRAENAAVSFYRPKFNKKTPPVA